MSMLTVIIPARNEIYLQKTIENVLQRAEGEIEVIAVCDGYWPDPPIQDDPRVNIIHHTEARGQRQSINEAAKIARGSHMMKLDGHCAVDQGFNRKLLEDCEYNWTVIPRMYNLDIATWEPKMHKRTDYMYMGWNEKNELRSLYYSGREWRRWHDRKELIDDTMGCMGPCFLMDLERFWELGGCDEGHGSWGQQGIEVAMKAWLSGGRLVVNKKTWFAHWFRGGYVHPDGSTGFPYRISGRAVDRARKYSMDLWLYNRWDKQVRDVGWLLEKFNPPTWERHRYMHLNSQQLMGEFASKYLSGQNLKILDLGSRVVKGQESIGSYRKHFNGHQYVGADLEAGNNVDVVLDNGYQFPFDDDSFDVVISGQTIEHIEFPWVWLTEIERVVKKGGLVCVIGPALIHEHKYPIDTYRYYPDGMRALAKWANLEVLEARRTRYDRKGIEDTILVARKP